MRRSALETGCEMSLGLLHVVVVLACLPTFVLEPLRAGVPRIAVLSAAAAYAVAGLHAVIRVRRRRRDGPDAPRRWELAGLTVLLMIHPVVALPTLPGLVTVGLLALVHLTLRQHSDEVGWAAVALALSLGLLVSVAGPGVIPALALPSVVVLATVAGVLLRARSLARRVERSERTASTAPDDGPRVAGRAASAVAVGVLLLVLTLAWFPVAQAPPDALRPLAAGERHRELEHDEEVRGREPAGVDSAAASELGPSLSFSSELALFGRIPMPPYEVLMRVVPRRDGVPVGRQGSLYLRGVALSRFTPRGARMRGGSAPTRMRDADDGEEDGWVVLDESVPPDDTLELLVEHYPAQLDDRGWSLLFAPLGLRAIGLAEVRWSPDRYMAHPDAPDSWFGYRLVVRDPGRPRRGILTARATHPDSRFVSLPPESAELDRIVGLAAGLTADRRTDLRRVQAVVEFFRNEFDYELTGSEFGGVAAMNEFLDRRAGFCTYFASTSALMLRSQGIPARVASGFLVQDWHDDGHYLAGPEDMHAWLEVHFEGLGWVAFEPTPADARSLVVDRDASGEPGVGRWANDLARRVSDWQRGGGDGTTARDVLATFADAPRRVGVSLRRNPWVTALLVLALLATAARLLLGRRRSSASSRARSTAERRAERLTEVLDRRLVAVGHPRPLGRPPATHVRGLALLGVPWADAAADLVDTLYAARFGGHPLDAEEAARLGRRIEAVVSEPPGEGSTTEGGREHVRA